MVDRILIAEDEADIRNLVKISLKKKGYEIIEAVDGVDAEEKIIDELPDLVLLDIVMPRKGGFDVCKSIKSNMNSSHIPILMFSVLNRPIDKKMSMEAGAEGHIVKPFIPEELATQIQKHLSESKKTRFSRAVGIPRDKVAGKLFLLEYNSSSPYERLVRDYLLVAYMNDEKPLVITRESSAIYNRVRDEPVSAEPFKLPIVLSQIIGTTTDFQLCMVFDNLTDLVLSAGFQTAYNFTRETLTRLSSLKASTLFLLNPDSHDTQEVQRLRNLFVNQLEFDKELRIKKLG